MPASRRHRPLEPRHLALDPCQHLLATPEVGMNRPFLIGALRDESFRLLAPGKQLVAPNCDLTRVCLHRGHETGVAAAQGRHIGELGEESVEAPRLEEHVDDQRRRPSAGSHALGSCARRGERPARATPRSIPRSPSAVASVSAGAYRRKAGLSARRACFDCMGHRPSGARPAVHRRVGIGLRCPVFELVDAPVDVVEALTQLLSQGADLADDVV